MSTGLIGRCDTGGLAALTREIHRHVHPARTLLVEVPDARRGDCSPDEYAHGQTYRTMFRGALPDLAIDWMTAEGIDQILSAETFYDDRLTLRAHQAGIRTVVYAMPELAPWEHNPREIRPRALMVPTGWRLDTLPNAQLLPFPVARDRLPYKQRLGVRHLFHPVGTEFHDRNGTNIFLAALPFVSTVGLRATILTHRPIQVPADTLVDVEVVQTDFVDYWEAYPPDIDLLVLPRRYGGLSLPVQECAALGVPALMLQTDPYASEQFVTAIPSTGAHNEPMKGAPREGVPVHSADPRVLATAIDFLARDAEYGKISDAADDWASTHDWDGPLGERWASMFG